MVILLKNIKNYIIDGAILTFGVISLFISSAIGGIVLLALAKNVGQVANATFKNSFLVCLISSVIILIFWYLMMDNPKAVARFFSDGGLGLLGVFVFNIITLSAAYIVVGKFVWKCTWLQSVKANIVWIIAYSGLIMYALNKITG